MNSGAERQGAIRNRSRAESGATGSFDPRTDAVTQRVTAATAQTRTQSHFPAGRPRQKARLGNEEGA
jgi:hypothetical protein